MNIQELSDAIEGLGLTVSGPGVEKETLTEALTKVRSFAQENLFRLQAQAQEHESTMEKVDAILGDKETPYF